ncbi:hypothetical protein D3C83_157260 [compost metagenome]
MMRSSLVSSHSAVASAGSNGAVVTGVADGSLTVGANNDGGSAANAPPDTRVAAIAMPKPAPRRSGADRGTR